jgi:hypothetical protein
VRHRTTFRSAMTIIMHIASPIIAAAEKIYIRLRHHHPAVVTSVPVTSVHVTHTTRQSRQYRNPQPNLDSVNRTVRLVPFDFHKP